MGFLITGYWYQATAHKLGINLTQAQLTQANPSGLFWRSNAGGALATTRSRSRLRATDFAEPQPPAGRS